MSRGWLRGPLSPPASTPPARPVGRPRYGSRPHGQPADAFRRRYPRVDLDPDVLFVADGRVLTSAGAASGVDICLHIVRTDHGSELANTVARRCVVPPFTFVRRFNDEVGLSPGRWLIQQRVARARHPLEAGDLPGDRIAAEVGFATGASLRQHLYAAIGVSPQAHRRTFRQAR